MTENATLAGAGEAAASPLPAFLTDHAPTRYRQRWTPLSRSPVTARLGEVWQVAAQRAATLRVIADRPADIDPQGPADRDYAGWAGLVEQAAGLAARGRCPPVGPGGRPQPTTWTSPCWRRHSQARRDSGHAGLDAYPGVCPRHAHPARQAVPRGRQHPAAAVRPGRGCGRRADHAHDHRGPYGSPRRGRSG
jgi:hypothetical protein